ncbi:MAG: glycosyltransferase family A protein [Sphingomicrobium sp.]
MNPRVSAIIIVRDGEQFIAEAIDSVIAQEGPAFELIVVDDGSSDATETIVQSYAGRLDGRLRVLHHPGHANLGMSASRNLGVADARGDYVAFLDADDRWLPAKLAEQVAILDSEPGTSMVYGRTLIWNSWDLTGGQRDFFYDLGVAPDATYRAGALFRQLLANRYQTPTTCNAMIRRDALIAVGGSDPRLRGMFEDQLLFAKLLLEYPVHVASQCWAQYRQHPRSASADAVDALDVDRAQLRYLAAVGEYLRHSQSVRLRDRVALAATTAKVAAQIVARHAKRALRRSAR